MNNEANIDELVSWIEDGSKVLTKKQKKQLNKKTTSTTKKNKKISKEIKDKLNKYSREKDPFWKTPLNERIQLQKQYRTMLQEEKDFKEKRMKEIMENMQNMSEQDQQDYLKQLLSNKEIEI